MSKALMISIRPRHLANILNDKKTLELRKSVPKGFKGWVNLYCTLAKPYLREVCQDEFWNTTYELFDKEPFGNTYLNGKLVARFWFDEYEKISLELIDKSGYDEDKLKEYESENMSNDELQHKLCLNDVEIDNYLNSYDGYVWYIKNLEIFEKPKELSDFGLKKAPQSWCYVYTKGE